MRIPDRKQQSPELEECAHALLITRIAALNNHLGQRIDQASPHLANGKITGAIGALDGAENDIATMRVLMLFVRDQLSPTTRQWRK